jgi:prefoldin subunit 5
VGVNDYEKDTRQAALTKRIDELVGRLDQLEKKSVQDSQKEILLFVGTGLFLILSFEFMTRR